MRQQNLPTPNPNLAPEELPARIALAEALNEAGVGAYVLFTQDDWHPSRYFPQDVDPHLFYPEAVYGTPSTQHLDVLAKETKVVSPDLRVRYDPDPTIADLYWHNPVSDTFRRTTPLFGNFIERERVASIALFVQPQPHSEKPAILMFAFRRGPDARAVDFTPGKQKALEQLARRVFARLPGQMRQRQANPAWHDAMLRSLRQVSEVQRFLARDLLSSPGTRPGAPFYEKLMTRALSHILASDSASAASLWKLSTQTGTLLLNREAIVGSYDPAQSVASQACDGSATSVTICSTLTGRPHLLSYIDAAGVVSVPIPDTAVKTLVSSPLPAGFRVGPESSSYSRVPRWRLEFDLKHRLDFEEHANTLRRALGQVHGGLIDRLTANVHASFSNLYLELGGDTQRARSELCIPIYVADQPVGCLNVESSLCRRFTPATMSVLMALRDALTIAIGREIDVDVLQSIHETSEKILRDSQAILNTSTLDDFAERVRCSVLCDEVLFCSQLRGASENRKASYDVAAASRAVSSRQRNIIRPSGWTDFLWNHRDPEVEGVLLDTNSPKAGVPLANAWLLKRENTGDPAGRLIGQLEPVPDRIRQILSLNNASQAARVRMQVGIKIVDPSNRAVRSVVWFSYIHPGRVYPDAGKVKLPVLLGCVRNLAATARWCSIVPEMVNSRSLMYGKFYKAMTHEGFSLMVESTEVDLRKVMDCLQARVMPPSEQLTEARSRTATAQLGVEYISAKIDALTQYSVFENQDELAQLVRKRASSFLLSDIIQDAWTLAKKAYSRKVYPRLEAQIPAGLRITTSRRHLLLLLVNVLINSIEHGRPVAGWPAAVVQIRTEAAEAGRIRIVIRDNGPGFEEQFLRTETQDILDRGVPHAKHERQGTMIIKRVSRAISGEMADLRNHPEGGAETAFSLPVTAAGGGSTK